MSFRRRAEPIAAQIEGFTHVPYGCRRCRWSGQIGVRGMGFVLRGATNPAEAIAVRKEAEAMAGRMVIPDAAASAGLTCCPRCGVRDEVAVRNLWRNAAWRGIGLAALFGFFRVCAGPMPWTMWGLALIVPAAVVAGSVWARLRRADKAVFFTLDAEGNASPPR